MIRVNRSIQIPEEEIEESFVRSSGPGGQHVNKVSSAVQLRFDVRNSASLPRAVRERLLATAGNRLSAEGVLIIEAQRFRSQQRNREDARERLVALVLKATEKPKLRHKTAPTKRARQERLERKRRRGEKKKLRTRVPLE